MVAADPDNIVFGNVYYNTTGSQFIYLVQGIDQNVDGSGGILSMFDGGIFSQTVVLGFQSVGINHGIDFIVEIYGCC